MSIARIKLDESTRLEFGVTITGAESRPTARLVVEGHDFDICFPCRPTNEGIEVEVSKLENILPAGEYPVRLEIMIENKVYIPFDDSIVLEPAVRVTTKPKETVKVQESVKVSKVVVKPEEKPVAKKESITESAKRRKIVNLIAKAMDYVPGDGLNETQIIEEALSSQRAISASKRKLIIEMLRAATAEEIPFNRLLVPKPLRD